jgi:hypothetical protein
MTWPKGVGIPRTPEQMAEIQKKAQAKLALKRGMTPEEWDAYCDAQDTKPKPNYLLDKSARRLLAMHPDRFSEFKPRNGYDRIVKLLIDAAEKGKDGQIVVQVFKELRDVLAGGSKVKPSASEERQSEMPKIVNDLPAKNYTNDVN